jgi:hypothetical protein
LISEKANSNEGICIRFIRDRISSLKVISSARIIIIKALNEEIKQEEAG